MAGILVIFIVLVLSKCLVMGGVPQKAMDGLRESDRLLPVCFSWIWRQQYPVLRAASREGGGDDGAKSAASRLVNLLWRTTPWYRYMSEKREDEAYAFEDPSYAAYLSSRKFINEHEYLFKYGGEDTNEGGAWLAAGSESKDTAKAAAGSENTQVESILNASVGPGSLPVHTVKSDRAVIGAQYVKEQLADYDFLMNHFYIVHASTTAGRDVMSADKLLSYDLSLNGSADKPQILIYHTHSQEQYADYGPEHPDGTVVGIGEYLTQLLSDKGYHVIHDTTVYDLQGETLDRNKAYTYALDGVTRILQENPSIEVILDVHRDGVKEGYHMVSEVNGKPTAPIMFFNGMSQTPDGPIEYLQNPYREENLAFSLQMQLDAEAYYPGFTRKIYLKGLRYNLHLRPRSALIEVGAQTNTSEEAKNAMEPLADLLDMVLQGD